MSQFQRENAIKGSKYDQLQEDFQQLKDQNTKKISTFESEKRLELQSLLKINNLK